MKQFGVGAWSDPNCSGYAGFTFFLEVFYFLIGYSMPWMARPWLDQVLRTGFSTLPMSGPVQQRINQIKQQITMIKRDVDHLKATYGINAYSPARYF